MGTSRAEIGFDPSHAFFGKRRAYNAATGGQTYRESRMLVEAAAAQGRLRQVLLVPDFAVSNAYVPEARDFSVDNYSPWRRWALAFSMHTLVQSLRTPIDQDEDRIREHIGLWLSDGRLESPTPTDHRAHALDSEHGYLAYHYFPRPHLAYASRSADREPIAELRRVTALAHERGIELTILIAPAHARQWQTIEAAGLWGQWEAWKRALVAMNEEEAHRHGRAAFPLWDFSAYNEITTEPFPARGERGARMRWYWDSSHFTKAAGDLALRRMLRTGGGDDGFGIRLDAANVESVLARIAAGQRDWARANPAEAAEIAAMAAQSRPAGSYLLTRSRAAP